VKPADGPGYKIAKTTPCKVEWPGLAAPVLRCVRGTRRKMVRHHGPNLISSRSSRSSACRGATPGTIARGWTFGFAVLVERRDDGAADTDDQGCTIMVGLFLDVAVAAVGRILQREFVIGV